MASPCGWSPKTLELLSRRPNVGLGFRLARFPQFYSRIGFVHEFRPLATNETRDLLEKGWTPPGVSLPERPLGPESVAAIIGMTAGNFRLLNRLLTQIERIIEVNALQEVTKSVVEAARESLVIGEARVSLTPFTGQKNYAR